MTRRALARCSAPGASARAHRFGVTVSSAGQRPLYRRRACCRISTLSSIVSPVDSLPILWPSPEASPRRAYLTELKPPSQCVPSPRPGERTPSAPRAAASCMRGVVTPSCDAPLLYLPSRSRSRRLTPFLLSRPQVSCSDARTRTRRQQRRSSVALASGVDGGGPGLCATRDMTGRSV